MPNLKLLALPSVVALALGCTAESPRPAVPAPPPTPAAARPDSAAMAIAIPAAPVADSAPTVGPLFELDTAEQTALRGSEGRASRVGTELRIQLLNGRFAVFKDDTIPPNFGLPKYAGYLKTVHSHIVHHVNLEGSGANIIVDDSTGDSVIVFGHVTPSPDGQRFVVMSMADAGAGYDPGLIEVWRIIARKPEKEFSLRTDDLPWQPSDAVWRDSTTVDFKKNEFVDFNTPDIQTPGRLVRSGRTWILADSSAHPQ